MLPKAWRQKQHPSPLQTNETPTGAQWTSISMNFSAVDFNPYQGTDKSPSNEIESGQSLQSFLTNSAIASSSRGDFDKVSIVPMPPPRHERSQLPQVSQLDLLALEKSLEPPLQIEPVPVNVTVGVEQRFWLIHQASGLRVPGQFSQSEAEYILKATSEGWDWEIEYRPRTPNCSRRLFCLLSTICTSEKVLEVAV